MRVLPRRWLSPHGLLLCGVAIVALYLAMHAAGLRDEARVLSGTPTDALSTALGLGYVVLHFAAVVAAPLLVGGAGLMLAVLLLKKRRRTR